MEIFEGFQATQVAKIWGLNEVSDFKRNFFLKSLLRFLKGYLEYKERSIQECIV